MEDIDIVENETTREQGKIWNYWINLPDPDTILYGWIIELPDITLLII